MIGTVPTILSEGGDIMLDLLYNNGDLTTDKYGDLVICRNEDEDIIQTANNNILTRFGHHKYHSEIGNKVFTRRIKAGDSGSEMVAEECKIAMLYDTRINEVQNINVIISKDDNTCIINYTLVVWVDIETEETRIVDGRCYVDALNQ